MTQRLGELPRVHVVTNDEVLSRDGWLRTAMSVLEVGGPAVALHLRAPRGDGRSIFRLIIDLLPVAERTKSWLVVNDRVDVGMAAGVGAIHLGGRSLPLKVARRLVAAGVRLGVSGHSVKDATEAQRGGADYAFVGTVFASASHPGVQGMGLEAFERVSAGTEDWPLVGIGGIGVERAGSVVAAGAHGVAAIAGIWNAQSPAVAVRGYIEAVEAVSCGVGHEMRREA